MKEKITQQSIRLFEKKGFSETSIQDIVDSLGVTKGTFYYYFSSKEELLMDIHYRYIYDLVENQQRIIDSGQQGCKDKLAEIVHMLIDNIDEQGASAKIFFREMKNLNKEHLEKIIPLRDQFRLNIEKLIKEGIDQGELKNHLNPPIVALGILGITNWSYQWFNPSGDLSSREVSDMFVDMILNGIAAE
ncbi:TetR family transcriptional regulator [Mesobacillus campisalis]|uniref:TetR family transcriptional regulator n=1 Tax=Mesobacillus campisalis TaxID=1408103 RepID=A0A0M2SWJ2_9BACI|nr:TetR/AcrR family transcriptional regulator [Mesobacillus campisalis]KKK36995.1 TetR family transcriptional regulator [Mesobacillus campisalis]